MVRLQPLTTNLKWSFSENVSIPLWFDYNLRKDYPINLEVAESQFHYGSITTSDSDVDKNVLCLSLNSTMVRLQQAIAVLAETKYKSLNSTMVRLQPIIFNDSPKIDDKSQFHYGSITTFLALRQFYYICRTLRY